MTNNLRTAPARLLLADWAVDAVTDRIRQGVTEQLESKMMAVLVDLATRAGEVCTREELERDIWHGPNLLSSYVYLTAALSELGRSDDAAWTAAQLRMLVPEFKVSGVNDMLPIENAARLTVMTERLCRAGL